MKDMITVTLLILNAILGIINYKDKRYKTAIAHGVGFGTCLAYIFDYLINT